MNRWTLLKIIAGIIVLGACILIGEGKMQPTDLPPASATPSSNK